MNLRERLAELVAQASDGEISAAEALAEPRSLTMLGLTSLGHLRLIDAVEREFAVALDADGGTAYLETVERLAGRLAGAGVTVREAGGEVA